MEQTTPITRPVEFYSQNYISLIRQQISNTNFKVLELVRVGFMRQFKEYMDLMAEKSEYSTAEWEFKRGDMLTQALKKTHFQWEMEELNDSYEHFKSVYQSAQTLPSASQCEKYIAELGISEENAIKTIKELLKYWTNK